MLFHQMNWRIDAEHQLYKAYRLRLASVDIQKCKCTRASTAIDRSANGLLPPPHPPDASQPADHTHLIRDDPAEHPPAEAALHYRCRKCRRTLATDANHFRHARHSTVANPSSAYDEHNGLLADILATAGHRPNAHAVGCTESIFVEPMAWMASVALERQGKLLCPKCQTKVGSFDWADGCQCPCGALVAPAFYLVPSKVELRRPLTMARQ